MIHTNTPPPPWLQLWNNVTTKHGVHSTCAAQAKVWPHHHTTSDLMVFKSEIMNEQKPTTLTIRAVQPETCCRCGMAAQHWLET